MFFFLLPPPPPTPPLPPSLVFSLSTFTNVHSCCEHEVHSHLLPWLRAIVQLSPAASEAGCGGKRQSREMETEEEEENEEVEDDINTE